MNSRHDFLKAELVSWNNCSLEGLLMLRKDTLYRAVSWLNLHTHDYREPWASAGQNTLLVAAGFFYFGTSFH